MNNRDIYQEVLNIVSSYEMTPEEFCRIVGFLILRVRRFSPSPEDNPWKRWSITANNIIREIDKYGTLFYR